MPKQEGSIRKLQVHYCIAGLDLNVCSVCQQTVVSQQGPAQPAKTAAAHSNLNGNRNIHNKEPNIV